MKRATGKFQLPSSVAPTARASVIEAALPLSIRLINETSGTYSRAMCCTARTASLA
jgi:hypothetical protein